MSRPSHAIPTPPPIEGAPFGTWVCRGVRHRELIPIIKGRQPPRCSLGHQMVVHPVTRKELREAAKAVARRPKNPAELEDLIPLPRLTAIESPMETWDAAWECDHFKLPHEQCDPCGRLNVWESMFDPAYPGMKRMVALERIVTGG